MAEDGDQQGLEYQLPCKILDVGMFADLVQYVFFHV
jgi:hypothetical protein